MLVFTVRNDKVSAIEAAYPDARLVLSAAQQNQDAFQKRVHPGFLYSRDFSFSRIYAGASVSGAFLGYVGEKGSQQPGRNLVLSGICSKNVHAG